MLSLNDFLQDCKTRIHQNQQQQQGYHLVIGNEAGDADSIISAISLAHVEALRRSELTSSTTKTSISDDAKKRMTMTPIVSVPQEALATQRPETVLLLKLAGVSLDNLIFVNQLDDILSRSEAVDHHLTLMDHNRLSSNPQVFQDFKVVEILDHHYDEGAHVDTCPLSSSRRLVAFENSQAKGHGEQGDNPQQQGGGGGGGALVASTCTLVAERLISIWDARSRSSDSTFCGDIAETARLSLYPPSLALVLLGTILLDSVNMSPAAGKGTERDAKAFASLLHGTDWSSLPPTTLHQLSFSSSSPNVAATMTSHHPDTTALFQVLQNAKFDLEFWKSLSIRDALNLDYKQFTAGMSSSSSQQQQADKQEQISQSSSHSYTFGLSTVLMPVSDFLSKPNVRQEILSYMQREDTQVAFLGIMLAFSDDASAEDSGGKQIRRQLILCATTNTTKSSIPLQNNLLQEIMDFLVQKKHDGDGLEIQEMQSVEALSAAATKEDDDGLMLRFLNQGNTQASRKIVAPIFLQFFEQNLSFKASL
jgi:exopolyphosphatase